MGIGSWLYLKFLWADTAGWRIKFLHFVCSFPTIAQACCHAASLVVRFAAPHCPIFPPKYCGSPCATLFTHSVFFVIIFLHSFKVSHSVLIAPPIPEPCVLKLLLASLSGSGILPVSCLNALLIVRLITVTHCSPPYLHLTVSLYACLLLQPQPFTLNLELGLCEPHIVLYIHFCTFFCLQIMPGTHWVSFFFFFWVSFIYAYWLEKIPSHSEM